MNLNNVNRMSSSTIETNCYSNGRAGNNLVAQNRASTSLDNHNPLINNSISIDVDSISLNASGNVLGAKIIDANRKNKKSLNQS